ncbi:MAG TPA: hypothetical protein VIH35_06235 [Kiritimatiellia bacterium]|jgi:hypothetical protein
MKASCSSATTTLALFLAASASIHAGELKKDYFGATKVGAWVAQELTSTDGAKSTYTSQRLPDDNGQAVVELSVKVLAGPGAGSESKNTITLPKGFNIARDWLSYGKFTEKMTMAYGDTVMPIDGATLDAIRKSSKDYRGAVTFEAKEKIDGHACDRYGYSIVYVGPPSSVESGQLWLDDTVPFGLVRQVAKVLNDDGSPAASYEIRTTDIGLEQMDSGATETTAAEPAAPAAPSVVTLLEGYNAGSIALEISAPAGSGGRKLEIALRNKTESDLTVKIPSGVVAIAGSSPVSDLKVTLAPTPDVVLGPGETSAPIPAAQRGTWGPQEGKFTLSVYEGTPLYSGSATVGPLAK